MSYRGFASEDDYLDALYEARQEAADELMVQCADCGHRWDPGYHQATRWEPAYEVLPECTACGGLARTDD